MIYIVEFVIDNGCTTTNHIAVVRAENTGEAMFKFNKYVDSKLGYDEVVSESRFTNVTDKETVLYCDYRKEDNYDS